MHELETHPPARDWTAAAVPWPYSPPGPSHTLPPRMTSPAYWPLKQSNKDECRLSTKTGRGTSAARPSPHRHAWNLVAMGQCRIHASGKLCLVWLSLLLHHIIITEIISVDESTQDMIQRWCTVHSCYTCYASIGRLLCMRHVLENHFLDYK